MMYEIKFDPIVTLSSEETILLLITLPGRKYFEKYYGYGKNTPCFHLFEAYQSSNKNISRSIPIYAATEVGFEREIFL